MAHGGGRATSLQGTLVKWFLGCCPSGAAGPGPPGSRCTCPVHLSCFLPLLLRLFGCPSRQGSCHVHCRRGKGRRGDRNGGGIVWMQTKAQPCYSLDHPACHSQPRRKSPQSQSPTCPAIRLLVSSLWRLVDGPKGCGGIGRGSEPSAWGKKHQNPLSPHK